MDNRPATIGLVVGQVRHQNRLFWRSPVSAFFTLMFPLMFLIVFGLVFGNEEIEETGLTVSQFYAPALAVFGAVSATFMNLAIGTAIARDEGILKRIRGTPLPPWIYIAGRVGSALLLAGLAAVIMLAVGVAGYGLEIFTESIPALIVTFLVGVTTFAVLGLLLAAVSPSADAAPALANAAIVPLAFFSDIFIVTGPNTAEWVKALANVFPLRRFATAFIDGFEPLSVASRSGWLDHFHWGDIGVMAVWLAVGLALTLRLFSWKPRSEQS